MGSRKYHYTRGIHCRGNAEATTSRPLPRHTRRRLHRGGSDLSLSLSRSLTLSVHLTLQLLNNPYENCALSRIYTYTTFRHIYISVLPVGSVPIGSGSATSRFSASFIRFHPVPSGGTCFPTNSLMNYLIHPLCDSIFL